MAWTERQKAMLAEMGLKVWSTDVQPQVIEAPVPLQEDIRVLRGGSWSLGWHKSRSTVRSRWKRTEVSVHAGVRCASR